MNNLIQQLMNNEKPFGLMSKEMQAKAMEIDLIKSFRLFVGPGWGGVFEATGCKFHDAKTYRLRSDFKDEPGIVEYPIFELDGRLKYKRNLADGNDFGIDIDMAARNPDFIGFKFERGDVCNTPVAYLFGSELLHCGSTAKELASGKHTEVHATHVLFRRQK